MLANFDESINNLGGVLIIFNTHAPRTSCEAKGCMICNVAQTGGLSQGGPDWIGSYFEVGVTDLG